MPRQTTPLTPVLARLKWPLTLTWAGLIAERVLRAFWPLWSLIALCAAALMLGLHDLLPLEVVWALSVAAFLGSLIFVYSGARAFRWPVRAVAVARLDASLPGHPLTALRDAQVIGGGDPESEALWRAHQARMAERAAQAQPVQPDLKLARRDPFGLRYVALLGLIVALLFGSVWRVGTVGELRPGGAAALASGPAWEGWIEPPAYTGLPSLYLNDQRGQIGVPEGSRITLRLYGEVGALSVAETVSGRTDDIGAATQPEQSFDVAQSGLLQIDGPGGQSWDITAQADAPPGVEILEDGRETTFDGQMSQPFRAIDDYAVTAGTATFRLDMPAVDRRFGLATEPEPRSPIELDLPMPITGDRAEFTETLIENLSQHPWAHLPVTLQVQVEDAAGNVGQSPPKAMALPARRFFDPLAAAVIEQRRDLLWSKANAKRVTQVLRAVSYKPEDGLFRREADYLKLRVILRRLETLVQTDGFDDPARDQIAQALWDLALTLEEGDIGDALERMRAAQERLSEAMKNGASQEEIDRLMQELRQATADYMRQKMQQAQREQQEGGDPQQGEMDQDMMRMTQQDLQDMMDRIQELMEQGRMAEAQQALEEFQQMMENMRVTQGQGGQQGQSPGQQAMEGLAETLRDQQGLSDEAFRDLQEQFNPDAQAGERQGNQGRNGGQGRGQSHEQQGQQGEGQGGQQPGQPGEQGGQPGQEQAERGNGAGGDLAERQEALRRELERQRGGLPGGGSEAGDAAREALERAERAMEGAEQALRGDDLPEALDRQSEAMEALRDGMRNLGEAMAEANREQQGGQGQARGQPGQQQSDPLGRRSGDGNQVGTEDSLLQGEDIYRRARELLDEIRRRSGDGERPEVELDYLKRLLDRF